MGYMDVVCGVHEYLALETTRSAGVRRRPRGDDGRRQRASRGGASRGGARARVRARGVTRVERDATRAVSTSTRDGDDARAVIRDVAGAV